MAPDFVVDCSVTMAWCFEDEATEKTTAILRSFKKATAIVPSIWPLEVANTFLVAERKKRITQENVDTGTRLLQDLPITVDGETSKKAMREIIDIARKFHLSSYDAAYLELALRENIPLATNDGDLKKAAKKAGVHLVNPSVTSEKHTSTRI